MLLRVLVATVFACVVFDPTVIQAQSRAEAIRLHKEASDMHEQARSDEDLRKAVLKYEEARRIYNKIGDAGGLARVQSNLGSIYTGFGQYDKAMEYYAQASAYYEEEAKKDPKLSKARASSLAGVGHQFAGLGNNDQAIVHFEKSLTIFRGLGDRNGQAAVVRDLGKVHESKGDYAKAAECYEACLAILVEIEDKWQQAWLLNDLGSVYVIAGQYDKALTRYEEALRLWLELGDLMGVGQTHIGLGNVYECWGHYDKAINHYEKALAIFLETKDRLREGLALNNLGLVYRKSGQHEKAKEYFEKSLAICRLLNDLRGEVLSLCSLADVAADQGNVAWALELYQKALTICLEKHIRPEVVKNGMGNLYLDMGNVDAAEPFIREVGMDSSLARLALMKSDWKAAQQHYTQVLKRAEQNRNAEQLFVGYTGLGMCHEGLGENQQAADYLAKAVEFAEQLRGRMDTAFRRNFFNVRIAGFSRTAPYEALARVYGKMNRPIEAFKVSELTHARTFAESLSKRNATNAPDIPPDILERDGKLNDQIAATRRSLQTAYEQGDQQTITALEPHAKDLEANLKAHVDRLWKHHPFFAATHYPQPMYLAQTALSGDDWVLAYHVTDSGVIIYLANGKQIVKALFRPILRKEMDGLVSKFRSPLAMGVAFARDKLGSFDFATGKQLADLLLNGVLDLIPKNAPLIIVPDGTLSLLPFEILVLNDRGRIVDRNNRPSVVDAEFFGDHHAISYCQSVTALTLVRTLAQKNQASSKVLVMDDPVFSANDDRMRQKSDRRKQELWKAAPEELMSAKVGITLHFCRLPDTQRLGRAIQALYPSDTERYTGLEATKQLLLSKPLETYGSIIFATHGYFGNNIPGLKEPFLALTMVDQPPGEDGFLHMSEVMSLNLRADIVALAASQSGLGTYLPGEGVMGMGQAFHFAGAKSVLMSLWAPSETASVLLMESFFKHLKSGKSKVEALKIAREDVRREGFDHPFFWAPFVLVGEVN